MNIKLTLGERLKDLRVERSLKLETLAEQTGLSKSALSKYESDDVTDLSIYAVTTLAEFYGVTTDYLLGVTENKKRPDAVLSDLHLSDGAMVDNLMKELEDAQKLEGSADEKKIRTALKAIGINYDKLTEDERKLIKKILYKTAMLKPGTLAGNRGKHRR